MRKEDEDRKKEGKYERIREGRRRNNRAIQKGNDTRKYGRG